MFPAAARLSRNECFTLKVTAESNRPLFEARPPCPRLAATEISRDAMIASRRGGSKVDATVSLLANERADPWAVLAYRPRMNSVPGKSSEL